MKTMMCLNYIQKSIGFIVRLAFFAWCLTFSMLVYAEQQEVKIFHEKTNMSPDPNIITYDLGGQVNNPLTWDDGGFIRLNKTGNSAEASITFKANSGTIFKTYSFNVGNNGGAGWLSKDYPDYKINDGSFVETTGKIQDNQYNRATLKITTKIASRYGSHYYINLNSFTFNVIIPEVVDLEDRTVALERLKESDLNKGTITRTTNLEFKVKDPIDTNNPYTYFSANITSKTGESWTHGTMKCSSTADGDGNYTITVPITYTATNKTSGNFEANVQLTSINGVNTKSDDCKVTIAVNVKQDYTIDWNFGWNSDKQWTVDKGISIKREDYLINEEDVTVLGKTLSIPTSNNETVVKVNQETGEITMVGEGEATLTYVQQGDDEYNTKTLTVGLLVQRKSPQFTIHSESTYVQGGKTYHVFYVNKFYSTFITSDNEDYDKYKMEVKHTDSNNEQFIEFGQMLGFVATTGSVPKDGIEITVSQAEGDLWVEKEETIYISVRENPIHVGTLCNRTLEELYYDDNFTVDRKGSSNYRDGYITVGSAAGGSTGGYVIFHFEGTPDQLDIAVSCTSGSGTIKYYESDQKDGNYTELENNTFKATSRYLKVLVEGSKTGYKITSLCITEKFGVDFVPETIDMMKMEDNVFDFNVAANVSNLLNLDLSFEGTNAGDFRMKRPDGDAFSETLSVDYTDGLGIDKYTSVPVVISYVGDPASAIGKTANLVAKWDGVTYPYPTAPITITEVSQTGGAPNEIFVGNAATTGIFTGTDCPRDQFPYKPKTQVNLSSCFGTDGQPLFDVLYVFGLTTNTNDATYTYNKQVYPRINTPTNPDNATTCFNAFTPLYVYEKNGSSYQLKETIDATAKRFDHNTSMNGKKIYFTGYCPFAYMGTTANEEGWMYFKGGNTSVDIYLENCEIRGRYKTVNGCNRSSGVDYADFTLELGLGDNYIKGCSSPFVFYSTATASDVYYKPNFHIKGDNFLQGQYGMFIKSVVGKVVITIETGITNISQASAPITIRADKNSGKTNLIFDDNWADGTITNGFLKLTAAMSQIGSLDLGSDAGQATFNGGQYCLRNAAADGNYTTNIMASYRRYSKTAAGFTIYLYGFGGDIPSNCQVTINSGTFTLEKNTNPGAGQSYYLDQENFMDLRLPGQSVVNGGTFNGISNVVKCVEATTQGVNPINGKEYALCLRSIVPSSEPTPYGSKTFTFDHPSFGGINFIDAYANVPPIVTDLRNTSGMTAVAEGNAYGAQSLLPDEEGRLNLLLPLNASYPGEEGPWCEALENTLLRQWATCVPTMNVSKSGQSVGVGGDIEVIENIDGMNVNTNNLLYLDADDMMKEVEIVDGEMHIQCGANRADITNEESFRIKKHLNIIKAIEADQWMTIVAPFDVHDISILEAVAEKDLEAMETREDAHRAQATAFLNFFNEISGFVIPDDAGRTTSHPLTTLMEWYGVRPYELIHYNGANIREANYYLYELDNLNNDSSFSTNATGEELNIVWKPVATPKENDPILKRGQVYAMQFPYCPLCKDADKRTEYDYWTGKYILLHGEGEQRLDGTKTHNTLLTNKLPEAGSAILKGNTSLNALTLPASTGYIHNTSSDYYELKTSEYSVKPMETFMFYNPLTARMPKAISRAGKVIYEEQTATGLPTIGDRTTLNAYANNMQIHLTALQAQHAVIYDMHGQVLFEGQLMEGEQMSISAPQGIYIVKGTYEIIKLIVD